MIDDPTIAETREAQARAHAIRASQLVSDLLAEHQFDYDMALKAACHKIAVLEANERRGQ